MLSYFLLGVRSTFAHTGLTIPASEVAIKNDALYAFLVWLSVFFTILVVGGMIYLAIEYRRGRPGNTKLIVDNHMLEIVWTAIPTLILLGIFYWGYNVYREMVTPPAGAQEIRVVGKQWSWTFQYDDGKITDQLYVPIHKPVRLVMSSEDVLHSFFIPNLRIKQDVVPGMYTYLWFEATVAGKHPVFCAEYCGGSHSGMLSHVVVLTDEQWAEFKNKGKEFPDLPRADGVSEVKPASAAAASGNAAGFSALALAGKKLVETKGCLACHSLDGTPKIGPSLKGIFGHEVTLATGAKVMVDENYVRESVEDPMAKVVAGFAPSMPTFKGQFKETEMNSLVTFIKELK